MINKDIYVLVARSGVFSNLNYVTKLWLIRFPCSFTYESQGQIQVSLSGKRFTLKLEIHASTAILQHLLHFLPFVLHFYTVAIW